MKETTVIGALSESLRPVAIPLIACVFLPPLLVWIAERWRQEQPPRAWTYTIATDSGRTFTFSYPSQAACEADIDRVEGEHPHPTLPRTTLHGCEPQQ